MPSPGKMLRKRGTAESEATAVINLLEVLPMMVLQFTLQLVALYWVRRCYVRYPEKRWRFTALLVWLIIAVAGTLTQAAIVIWFPPMTSEGLFRTIHWISKTTSTIGYLAVAVTCWCIADYYERLGYAK